MKTVSLSLSNALQLDPSAYRLFEVTCFIFSLLPARFLNKGDQRIWRFALNEWLERLDQFLKEEVSDFEKEPGLPEEEPKKMAKTQRKPMLLPMWNKCHKTFRTSIRRVSGFFLFLTKTGVRKLKRCVLWGIEAVEKFMEKSKRPKEVQRGTMIEDDNRFKTT